MKIVLILIGVVLIAFVVTQLFAYNSQRNIETYSYSINKKYNTFEIRSYEETLFTSIKLSTKGYENSSSKGFSILAGYIFGGNERNEKISMTSPVAMKLEDSMTMMFMVPKELKKEMLPKPNQSLIEFKEEPAKTVAAISFSGWANNKKIEKYKQKLQSALDAEGIAYTERFYFLGYNAPYEFFNRKNEVIVELRGFTLDQQKK
ncbi:MAG: heme-binding protein [Flavobacteriaceae bacterium]|nr:heme-binding protein [Flavobacteriaceae bacterium]MBT3919814.1 heme-binding protein [Flavobacteriaceae bacterium]MBT6704512.1 heme-binding protein [Flavobacteriaceae bacterium]MBT7242219.1 heme-binding protein [Flavobacteriaceae bacterium]